MTIEGEFVQKDDESAVAVREPVDIGLLRDPDLVLDEAHKAAAALGKVIATKARKVVLNGKQYLEVEDWVLLGQFYGVSGKTEWTHPVEVGEAKGWEARVVLIDQRTGHEVGGAEAMCLNTERNWRGKDDFQLRSMAQTRALGKALSGKLRWIPVLAGYSGTPAEDIDAPPSARPAPTTEPEKLTRPQAETKLGLAVDERVIDAARKTASPLGVTAAQIRLKEWGFDTWQKFYDHGTPVQGAEVLKALSQ